MQFFKNIFYKFYILVVKFLNAKNSKQSSFLLQTKNENHIIIIEIVKRFVGDKNDFY